MLNFETKESTTRIDHHNPSVNLNNGWTKYVRIHHLKIFTLDRFKIYGVNLNLFIGEVTNSKLAKQHTEVIRPLYYLLNVVADVSALRKKDQTDRRPVFISLVYLANFYTHTQTLSTFKTYLNHIYTRIHTLDYISIYMWMYMLIAALAKTIH